MIYVRSWALDHPVIQMARSCVFIIMQVAAFQGLVFVPAPFGGLYMADSRQGAEMADPALLIARVASRQDRDAFAALFNLYAPKVKAFMMRQGTSSELAEDIAQEVLLTVWRKASFFDPSRAAVSAWIFAIARNLRIDRLRRDQRAKLHEIYELIEPEAPPRPDGLLDIGERERRVSDALGELPAEQLQVVRLSFFEGHAHGDIARILEIPLGTVKSRLRLAVNRLSQFLGDLK